MGDCFHDFVVELHGFLGEGKVFRRQEVQGLLQGLAGGVELLEVGDDIVDVGLGRQAGEDHLRSRNLRFGVFDVFPETGFVPGNAGVLVGRGIVESLVGAGLAAIDAVERRAELHLCSLRKALRLTDGIFDGLGPSLVGQLFEIARGRPCGLLRMGQRSPRQRERRCGA